MSTSPSLTSKVSSSTENLVSKTKKLLSRISSVFENKEETSSLPEPPQYLLDHFNGDTKKAAKAHKIVSDWRLDNDIDDRIKFKPKNYDIVGEYLHSCLLGRGKSGVDLVLAESYDTYNLKRFKELGIEPKDFQDFVILFQEYVHTVLNEDPNMEKENGIYTVLDASTLDVKGLLNPKIAPYNDITLKTLDTYYLTRSKKVFVVNHPRFLNMFWPAIKAAMPSNIQKKLVLVKNKKEIEDYMDLNILPTKLGGTNPNEANQSEMFLQFQNFVNSLPTEEEFYANPANNYEKPI